MTLIIGTKNPAKINQVRSALKTLNLDIQGLADQTLPEVPETGETALENAKLKALAYSAAIGQPVLSTDNALYIDGLSSERQPGINVRSFRGRNERPSDQEALDYYANLVGELGGRVNAYWEYGICLAYPDGRSTEMILKSPRLLVLPPSKNIIEGYPLEAIQFDLISGKYISDMSPDEQDIFWQRAIGTELCNFVKNNLI